jgi:hypothetical protein
LRCRVASRLGVEQLAAPLEVAAEAARQAAFDVTPEIHDLIDPAAPRFPGRGVLEQKQVLDDARGPAAQ